MIERRFGSMGRIRIILPDMSGQINIMHSKLMLLFNENRLRIAVPTANLTPYDWGEAGGVMENVSCAGQICGSLRLIAVRRCF